MKTLALLVGLIALPSLPQKSARPSTQQAAGKRGIQRNLRYGFAESSLRILRMIEAETAAFDEGPDGSLLVPRATKDALDSLDIDAETKAEEAVVAVLNTFLTARVTNNTAIAAISAKIALSLSGKDEVVLHRSQEISELVNQNFSVAEMHKKEAACSTQLKAVLRSRRYRQIPACNEKALAVKVRQ